VELGGAFCFVRLLFKIPTKKKKIYKKDMKK